MPTAGQHELDGLLPPFTLNDCEMALTDHNHMIKTLGAKRPPD